MARDFDLKKCRDVFNLYDAVCSNSFLVTIFKEENFNLSFKSIN